MQSPSCGGAGKHGKHHLPPVATQVGPPRAPWVALSLPMCLCFKDLCLLGKTVHSVTSTRKRLGVHTRIEVADFVLPGARGATLIACVHTYLYING